MSDKHTHLTKIDMSLCLSAFRCTALRCIALLGGFLELVALSDLGDFSLRLVIYLELILFALRRGFALRVLCLVLCRIASCFGVGVSCVTALWCVHFALVF